MFDHFYPSCLKRCPHIYYDGGKMSEENVGKSKAQLIVKTEGKKDVEELKEVLTTISEFIPKIPELIKSLLTAVYSEETGREIGKAVATFYKTLIENGIPKETALKMTEEYLSTFTKLGKSLAEIKAGKD